MPKPGIAAVAAQVHVGRIRPDHGNGLRLCEIERKQILFVLEQDHDFARRSPASFRCSALLFTRSAYIRIDIRMIEQTQPELGRQHARHRAIDFAHRHQSLLHLGDERAVSRCHRTRS